MERVQFPMSQHTNHANMRRSFPVARRKQRKYKQKSASFSCRTCRSKKVKCDGAHPACIRCINSYCICGGYPSWDVAFTAPPCSGDVSITVDDPARAPDQLLETEALATTDTLELPLPMNLRRSRPYVTEKARADVSFFIQIGMPNLIGQSPYRKLSETSFNYIFSLMLDEPMLFHGIFALATLQRAKIRIVHSNLPLAIDDDQLRDCLEQYGKALSTSREHIAILDPRAENLSHLILAGYVMFLFELCQGNWASATRHRRLSSAIARMHEGRLGLQPADAISKSAISVVKADDTYDPLLESRLTSFFDLNRALELLITDSRQFEVDFLGSVKTLGERVAKSNGITDVGHKRCLMHCLARVAPLEHGISQRMERLLQSHIAWKAKFDAWRMTEQQDPHFVLCEINQFASEFSIRTYRNMDRTSAVRYESLCEDVLQVIKSYLHQRRTLQAIGCDLPTSGPNTAVSAFEYGILRALYLVSVRCTSLEVRLRAIKMLRKLRRKELEHDSTTLATAARVTLAVQEHRADEMEPKGIGLLNFETIVRKAANDDMLVSLDPMEDGSLSVWYGKVEQGIQNSIELTEYEVLPQILGNEGSGSPRPAKVNLIDTIGIDLRTVDM